MIKALDQFQIQIRQEDTDIYVRNQPAKGK
jgi:hypothetical protein